MKQELFTDGSLAATELFDYNERFYDQKEFHDMLEAAGFVDIKVAKGYEEGDIGPHDTMVFTCRKPE